MNPAKGPARRDEGKGLGFSGFVDTILTFFSKSGPWAVLCLLILGWLAFELDGVIKSAGKGVTDYVMTSSQNIEAMNTAMGKLQESQSELIGSMNQAQQSVTANGQAIAVTQEQVKKVVEQIQMAYDMMKDVPGQRREAAEQDRRQVEILNNIQKALEILNDQVGGMPLNEAQARIGKEG